MQCPVCARPVSTKSTGCLACGTDFLSGEWQPTPTRTLRKLRGFRLAGVIVGVPTLAAAATVAVALVRNPPTTGDGGHISLLWLLAVIEEGTAFGLPLFVVLCLVGFLIVFVLQQPSSR